MADKKTNDKRVKEIFELLARSVPPLEICQRFVDKWQTTDRTIYRYIRKAKALITEVNKAETEILDSNKVKLLRTFDPQLVSDKMEDLAILTTIARGKKLEKTVIIDGKPFDIDYIPADHSRIAAIELKARMQGFLEPIKSDIRVQHIPVLKSEIIALPALPPVEEQQKALENE